MSDTIKPITGISEELFQRLCGYCVVSNHFSVAERTLFLLNNENLVKIIQENRVSLFPFILKGLLKNSKSHWQQSIQTLTFNVLKQLKDMDEVLFDDISKKVEEAETEDKKDDSLRTQNDDKWAELEKMFN